MCVRLDTTALMLEKSKGKSSNISFRSSAAKVRSPGLILEDSRRTEQAKYLLLTRGLFATHLTPNTGATLELITEHY